MNTSKSCAGSYDWKGGLVSGSVYYYNPELIDLVTEVYRKASYTNPLHPDLFPGLCKMEAEVVRIAANLFHGNEKTCGVVSDFFSNYRLNTFRIITKF